MAEAQLSAVLTSACLVMIFTVRKLGLVIAQRDSLSTSQKAMLKQVITALQLTIATHYNVVCSKSFAAVTWPCMQLVHNRYNAESLHTCE